MGSLRVFSPDGFYGYGDDRDDRALKGG